MSSAPQKLEPSISVERYYQIIRGQIEHEDNLIGQRLSWFVAAQSFYFTAYAIVMSNLKPQDHGPWVSSQMRLILLVLPVIAMVTSLLIYAAIIAGLIAMGRLRDLYDDYANHEHAVGLPPVQGYRRTQVLGQAAPMFLPGVFVVVWLALLIHGPW
jgi:hypothetical protein